MFVLAAEPLVRDQPPLFLVHRLDRLTSGLVVLAKSRAAAGEISREIRSREAEKIYLARVKGVCIYIHMFMYVYVCVCVCVCVRVNSVLNLPD